MSQKSCGSLLLFALVAGVSALALLGPSGKAAKWCRPSPVEALFMSCERVVMR